MKRILLLLVLLLSGCTASLSPPFTVVGKHVYPDGECYVTLHAHNNVEYYTYTGVNECKYNIGDVIQ